jgi:aldehyde dehydrogenase (NAD+)
MQALVAAQRSFFNSNATKPVAFRIAQLRKLRRLLEAHETALQDAIRLDYGKELFETFLTEFFLLYEELRLAIENIELWSRPQPVAINALNAPGSASVLPEPLGVGLVIGPWNYPYQLSLGPAIAAIAAGCTVVLKPSELTVHSSALLARLIRQTFDPAYFAVVEGGVAETTALLEQRFDMIFFTGSVAVGRIVYAAAAKHLTPVVLELGGKSPTIIAPDCKLDVAVRRLVWAKFLNAGQTCIAPDYVCVPRALSAAFIDALVAEINRVDYRVEQGNYVHIVSERNAARIAAMIDPAKVATGGGADIAARTIEPTVLRDVTWDDAVMQDEIFGPLLPVLVYDDLDALIDCIKQRPKPLALYLFTEDAHTQHKVLSQISFGGGCVNDAIMHITVGDLPFGGVGNSGMGHYHGEAGSRAFSHFKSVLKRDVVADPDIKFPPYDAAKLHTLKSVLGMATAADEHVPGERVPHAPAVRADIKEPRQ